MSNDLPEETLLAMLADRGIYQDQAGNLTRVYIVKVLQHPREKDGRLRDMRPVSRASPRDDLRALFRKRGVPAHLIEDRVNEMMAERAPKKKPGKRRK